MRREFKVSVLLFLMLVLCVAIPIQFIHPVDANPGNTLDSHPGNHSSTGITVTNPTLAYDNNPGSYAQFTYSQADGGFELYDFSTPTDVVAPLPDIESVDFHMRYFTTPNTAAVPDDKYRIMYYVGATPAAEPLVDWRTDYVKDLYVDNLDTNKTDWLREPAFPYLNSVGGGYIHEAMGVLLRPNGDGTYTAWTGVYTDWDDVTPDGNTTYVSATANNLNESSTIENPSLPLPTGTIDKVMVTINASNTVLSDDELNITVVIGGKAYDGHQEIFSPSRSYSQIESYWTKNPSTNSTWTWTDIDNLEVGVKSIQVGPTWDGEIRVTQMFVEVFCKDASIGDFSFEDIAPSADVGEVTLEIYTRTLGPAENDLVSLTLYNGASWVSVGDLAPTTAWGWKSVAGVNITASPWYLNTTGKINAAKVYLTKKTVDGGRNEVNPAIETIEVDAMRLRVYTKGYGLEAATYDWTNQTEPIDGTWDWTDVGNIRFAVETDQVNTADSGCIFREYEAWVTVNLPNAKMRVLPNSIVDETLQPEPTITIRPQSDGVKKMWTGSGSRPNYQYVDETVQNGDTDYIYASSAYRSESYNLENPTHPTWEPARVRVVVYAKYNIDCDEFLQLTLVIGLTEYRARLINDPLCSIQKFTLTNETYEKYFFDWGVNPSTKALWTWTDIDNLQAGLFSENNGPWDGGAEIRVTQLYVEISGPRFTVDVNAEDVTNLWGYTFKLSYDTTFLTATGFISPAPFTQYFPCQIKDTITPVTNEAVGTGNGTKIVFYLDNPPVIGGTDTIYVNGVPTTSYTIDYETGQITFTTAPGSGVVVTADYEYFAYLWDSYSMQVGTIEGASGNRTLATVVFLVEGYGRSALYLHNTKLSDPAEARILHDVHYGYFRNTFLSDIRGPVGPDYLPDGMVNMWDLGFIDLAYGKTSADPDWGEYMIADIRGPVGPDHLPDGVVDIWDLGYCGLEYGKSI